MLEVYPTPIYLTANKYDTVPIGLPNIASIHINFPLLVLINLTISGSCLVAYIYTIIHKLENISCRK